MDKHIHVNSMVASRNQKPFVTLKLGDQACQMTPNEARKIATWILECAEAAESDAFIVRFLGKEMDLGLEYAAKVLVAFRSKRKEEDDNGND